MKNFAAVIEGGYRATHFLALVAIVNPPSDLSRSTNRKLEGNGLEMKDGSPSTGTIHEIEAEVTAWKDTQTTLPGTTVNLLSVSAPATSAGTYAGRR